MANILVLRLSECKSRIRDTGTFNASRAATRSSVPHIEEQRAKASSSSSIEPQSSFSGLLSGVVAGTGEEVVADSFSDRQVPNASQAGTTLALLRPLLTRVAAVVEEMWWPSQMTVLGAGVWAPLRPTRPSVRDGKKGVVCSCSHSDGHLPPSSSVVVLTATTSRAREMEVNVAHNATVEPLVSCTNVAGGAMAISDIQC
jgi:hypothetical protein